MPSTGIPMLGNDSCGCCVWASRLHYLQLAELYVNNNLVQPTDAECIGDYSACTGYDPSNPTTDQGTYVQGPGGAIEYWINKGVACAGKRYFLKNAVAVNHMDLDHLKLALTLGPVFGGATIRVDDALSPFMWDVGTSAIDGGHEFLIVDCETISTGKTYFDICTWDGMWRATDDWVVAQMDEATMVLDPAFFGPSGLDPADMDMAAISAGMAALSS